jgi:hypothetical protein
VTPEDFAALGHTERTRGAMTLAWTPEGRRALAALWDAFADTTARPNLSLAVMKAGRVVDPSEGDVYRTLTSPIVYTGTPRPSREPRKVAPPTPRKAPRLRAVLKAISGGATEIEGLALDVDPAACHTCVECGATGRVGETFGVVVVDDTVVADSTCVTCKTRRTT